MEEKKPGRKYSFRNRIIGFYVATTLVVLLLCGGVLVLSMGKTLSPYIDKDLRFFLQEMNSNGDIQMEYLEDMVKRVRDNSILMEYLEAAKDGYQGKRTVPFVESEFLKSVDLFSSKNRKYEAEPFVEAVYLFDQNGAFFGQRYFPLLESERQEKDREASLGYQEFWQEYQQSDGSKSYEYRLSEDGSHIKLYFTVYDDTMYSIGTMLFVICTDALRDSMAKVGDYRDSFWFVFDENGRFLTGEGTEAIGKAEREEIMNTYHSSAYVYGAGDQDYLIHTQRMSMNWNCAIAIPQNQARLLLLDSTRIYVFIILLLTVCTSVSVFLLIYKMMRPLQEITDKLQMVQEDQFETKLPDYKSEEFHDISTVFNSMTEHINYLIHVVYEKQLSVKELELKFLQSQMNPHFMFNVLNSIALKAKMDHNDEIARMISSFSGLIQASIYRKENEKVQIRQELVYVNYYLYLQSFRYGERLTYEIKTEDDGVLDYYIPKLCIQLIVENAVVHGIEPKMTDCSVKVNIYTEEDNLYVDIIDDGVGFEIDGEIPLSMLVKSQSREHNRVGLNNAHSIIQMIYGEEYGISIYSERNKGCVVSIKIPQDMGQDKGDKDV